MFGFLIKKNFCDGWDNLFSLVLVNVIFLFAGMGLFLLNIAANVHPLFTILAIIFSFIVISILTFAYGETAAIIADFGSASLKEYFKAIPGVLKDASLFGLIYAVVIMLSTFSMKYYFFEANSMVGFCMGAAIAWFDLFFILSMQWFLPIRSLMHNNFKKCFKKSFIIFFDNTAFTIGMAIYNLLLLVFSIACIGFFPSMAGITIANTNALRLRLYKYDYLEEHPELKTKRERSKIPWEELIYEDRQTLGPRKLKSFLFPWKEED